MQYNPGASVEENIVFGRSADIDTAHHNAVRHAIGKVLDELDLRAVVMETGLDYQVGTGRTNLSAAQRQTASLARALMKRPDLLVLSRATCSACCGRSAIGGRGTIQKVAAANRTVAQ